MTELPICPKCGSEYTYQDREMYVCSMCAHEWSIHETEETAETSNEPVIRDSNGNVLADGDDVIVTQDLKVKGSSSMVKRGTKVKGIQLIFDAADGHDINCKIDGFGQMKLKSEFVKKA